MIGNISKKAFDIKEAREQVGGVSQAFFYGLIKNNEIRTFKIGNRRMVSAEAIDEFIKTQEQKELREKQTEAA